MALVKIWSNSIELAPIEN